MKAMIFAAGLGTRLGDLTQNKPKALVEINGIPLLKIAIRRLVFYGFSDIIINVHHFADQIYEFVLKYQGPAHLSIADERKQLLDTGGGLFNASWFFNSDEDFLVYNTDVLCDLNLLTIYGNHLKNKPLATLAVRNRPTSRYLLFDKNDLLCGWKNTKTNEKIQTRKASVQRPFAFSGIQVISPKIFKLFNPDKPIFSITNMYLELSKQENIRAFVDTSNYWSDVGKPEELLEASKHLESFLI